VVVVGSGQLQGGSVRQEKGDERVLGAHGKLQVEEDENCSECCCYCCYYCFCLWVRVEGAAL
jgi:hypothetical protein